MFVYLREEPVTLEMREVDPEGLVPPESGLVAVAFYANGNEQPSFRSLLPPETVLLLTEATQAPVQLGLLAEEPEEAGQEIRGMVGISVPVQGPFPEEEMEEGDAAEPWRSDPEAWRGAGLEQYETGGEQRERAALLAFAPLVRLHRKHPDDFGEELADLLETALAGETKPALEARVDRLLGDL
ncbi:MAG TPA: hypothetical protein VFX29_02790 [Longimicrobiaceae bacterium]|nr:hypothetical protein [Longimicrobiaceae bacterium]